jgi:apolipoprotein N-acyltransferase
VPLLAALDVRVREGASKRALFGLGYTFGLAFFLTGIHWIALLSDVASTVPWLKYPAWLVAAAYLSVFSGLTTLLAGWLARRAGVSLTVSFPLALLAIEELRASGEMGFPWFQPGYSQHAYAPIIQMASLGSVSLVTLWLAILNVVIWRALAGVARARAIAGAALLLLLPGTWGIRVLAAAPKPSGPAFSLALVQANIPGEMKWSGKHQPEILARFLELSARAAAGHPKPALIVWPETATGSYLRRQLDQAMAVAAFAARESVSVFTGLPDWTLGRDGAVQYVNGAVLFGFDGSLSPVYAKRHLVPVGERMPFQRFIPALGTISLGQAEWTPGSDTVLFPSAAGPFACLVCFESIFPELARADVRRGARWLVNITNDEWFGKSVALDQHAAMAVFRAVENHVPLARCANTGLTLIVDANGRVVQRVPEWQARVLSGSLAAPGLPTLYTRVGDWPGLLVVMAIVVLVARGGRRALTGREDHA